ncbi:hypothetical protein JVU11DRAFT_3253 [Chiua virens]|nr:hypothetical protein JVU11DRAFT_3253 [Chiua virens]
MILTSQVKLEAMQEVESYGQNLPGQVDRIADLFDAHLGLINEVHDIYQARGALEREYAAKLQQLVKRATDRKNKAATSLRNTLITAYAQIIASMSKVALDHVQLADTIVAQVTEPLKALERSNEGFKKKNKQKYDDECTEVEIHRQKQGHAQQDRHADRATRQYEQHQDNMLTSKNVYLVSIAVANKIKDRFYTEDLPNVEEYQNLFIDLNIRPFSLPNDWKFEPCASHYDTSDVSLEPSPKVFLQNKLARSRGKLEELESVLSSKRNEVEKYTHLIASSSADNTLGNDDAVNGYLDAQHQVTFFATSELVLRSEIDTIAAALAGDEGGSRPHDFKSSSFSIPTMCGYCKTSIWGLSKLGKTCKACGLSVHAKCELKVPAECTGVRGDHRVAETPSRTPSMTTRKEMGGEPSRVTSGRPSSTNSSAAGDTGETSTASSFVQVDLPHGHLSARVAYDFTATSPFELSVSEGTIVHVLEEDDGSGWVKVTDDCGGKGLIPASYLETTAVKLLEPSGSSEESRVFGQYVRVIYDYEAQGPDELSIKEGELLELSSGPYGGQNRADGWWEGYSNDGRKGIFPSNYVELT